MRRALLLMVAMFCAVPAPTAAQEALMITGNVTLTLPVSTCAIPTLARRIAEDLKLPAGIEMLPGQCVGPRRVRDRVPLTGMTLVEAMDRAVAEDPRYWWTLTDGVLVVRPIDAWGEREHFLHRTLTSFQVEHRNLDGIRKLVRQAVNGGEANDQPDQMTNTEEGDRRLSIDLSGVSIYETLNAIVRAHGALTWQVSYCREPARQEHSAVLFRTFDGAGMSTLYNMNDVPSCRQAPPLFQSR
jgi:hypothetical protein